MMKHPSQNIIQDFAKGKLNTSLSVMVSAHLDSCENCQGHYQKMMDLEARDLSTEVDPLSKVELDGAFDSIMSKIDSKSQAISDRALDQGIVTLEVSGQLIPLPRSMSFLKDQKIPWKEFGNKNAIAPISMGPEGNFYLIYIGEGEFVPKHNHSGLEYSYVAAGSYEDGLSTFQTGDFSVLGPGHTHLPKSTSPDGCLVISWVEGRLNYFDGIFKPLNRLLWWYLHRA